MIKTLSQSIPNPKVKANHSTPPAFLFPPFLPTTRPAQTWRYLNSSQLFNSNSLGLLNDLGAIHKTAGGSAGKPQTTVNLTTASHTNGHSIASQPELTITADFQTEYDVLWVWDDKCIFALRSLGKAYTSQVIKKLMELEPELKNDEKKTAAKTAYSLSHLYRDGRIKKVGQTGKKYLYSV